MKQLTEHIIEALENNLDFSPKDETDLAILINKLIKERGNEADLNDIDTSKITTMEDLFNGTDFDGNISNWDVSNVTNMYGMFANSKFSGKNSDLSKWNVGKVKNIALMFSNSKYDKKEDLEKWNISKLKKSYWAFDDCPLEKNPPKWYKTNK